MWAGGRVVFNVREEAAALMGLGRRTEETDQQVVESVGA